MENEAIQPGRWRHFKGKEYQVLGMARHSETLEQLVVYRALYGEGGLWVRPAAMWLETVDRDGYCGPRIRADRRLNHELYPLYDPIAGSWPFRSSGTAG